MKKSLIAMLALSSFAVADSSSLEEAFKNGKTSGDVSVYYESRHIDKGEKSTYYQNTAWAVGSIGINYETDYYKNFKFVAGFRAALPVYEKDKNTKTFHGIGDSTERVSENYRYNLSNLYLEYNANDTVIKIGRQNIYSDWVTQINDGVTIVNNSIKNLTLDALWTRARGKVKINEMTQVEKFNDTRGLFGAGATYSFENGLSFRAYGEHADNVLSVFGGKIMYDGKLNENVGFGGKLHYAKMDEKIKDIKDGEVFESVAYVSYNDTKLTLGYVAAGKDNGWGSSFKGGMYVGDTIVQFEEGDAMYTNDAKTIYAMLSTNIQKLSVSGIIGTTNYVAGEENKKYKQSEFSAWLSYPLTESLSASLKFDKTFGDYQDTPTYTQTSAGLTYKF
ncbi:porin [Campylobacter pinnipediorum subsp. pinnipediorum]|uniref:Opr family porin n=1 Tax=Campylobacter pinnipediorum TaxID=1965231 RepID=UPI0009952247|nr:Opr family porin [Campylobacter pinnipediorum]OPA76480.1 porin [Campylobacter pinnipediorum subsp. pinnipediorum]